MSPKKSSSLMRISLIAAVLMLVAIPTTAYADSFVVNTTDDNDDGQCDSNHCSLREAINAANANPGPDTISFAGLDATGGDVTIQLLSPLNPLIDNGTTVDGTTVVGYAGTPLVNVIKGAGVIEEGLSIQGDNCVVRGLSMAGFFGVPGEIGELQGGAIVVTGSGNLVENNVLGWGAFPNSRGVWLAGAGNSVIGNTISGNTLGIHMTWSNQVIQGNRIGTDPSGTVAVPNTIGIADEAASGGGHLIGGSNQGDGNLISGNSEYGVMLHSENITVQGNYIGTDMNGSSALPNQVGGLYITSINTLIGGTGQGDGNVISGNLIHGIELRSNGNTIQSNYIGTDNSGSSALPNLGTGIFVAGENNLIGGAGGGNLISGNGGHGVFLTTSDGANNIIQGNLVGTDSSGTNPIPNQGNGIYYIDGGGSTVGGLGPGEGNTIAFNLYDGADIEGPDQFILGNLIFNNGKHGIDFNGNALISQNSIYDNGDLGIKDTSPVDATVPPVLSPSYSAVNGTACAGCTIELFLAAPDPTGAGEGKEYLGTVTATSNGDFSFPLPPDFPFCGQVTATATDMDPQTSEFSLNVTPHCFQLEPPFLIPLWTFIITVFGFIGWRIRLRRPDSRFNIPVGLLLGAVVGAVLLGLASLLPAVQVEFDGEPAVPYSGQTADCADYLDPAGFSPQDGALLALTDDIPLSWAPSGDLPQGDLRWIVELVEVG
ncbi:MAG: CSLREA domain-containing protein, partial [Anaerolineales bacterium]